MKTLWSSSVEKSDLTPYTLSQLKDDNILKKYVKNLSDSESNDNTAYFVLSIKSGETVGIPVYFKDGMLDSNGKPKYSFEIMETSAEYYHIDGDQKMAAGDIDSNWILANITTNGTASQNTNTATANLSEEISLKYENIGRFKEIHLTKDVTFPDEDLLKNTAFRFKITRAKNDSTPTSDDNNKLWSDGKDIHWKLVDADGKIVTYENGGKTYAYQGTVSKNKDTDNNTEYGEMTIPLLGVKGYHAVLDNIEADYQYTITEILDSNESEITVSLPEVGGTESIDTKILILATEDSYRATTKTDTKQIPEKIVSMPMNIVNVYKKRDLKVQKTVVANPMPDKNTDYTFTIERKDGKTFTIEDGDYEVTDISGKTITSPPAIENIGSNNKKYRFSLKADEIITFHYIGNMNDGFLIKEEENNLPENIHRLVGADGETPVVLPENVSYITEEVVNGDPNFVVIRKSYTGNGYTESVREDILKKQLQMELNFFKLSDNSKIEVNEDIFKANVYLRTSDGMKALNEVSGSYADNKITMTGNDSIIVNLTEIAKTANLTKDEIRYKVTEMIPEESQKLIPNNEDAFYYIESAGSGTEKNEFSADGNSASLNIINTVTKYGSIIYKRIISENKPESLSGNIAFNIVDKETGEAPENSIYYVPAYEDENGNTTAIVSERGAVGNGDGSFSISSSSFSNVAWKKKNAKQVTSATRGYYVLKIYLSEKVAINSDSGYTITEDLANTDKSWGILVGYEATEQGKVDTVTGDGSISYLMSTNQQWSFNDMDTFVNTNMETTISLGKTVSLPEGADDALQNDASTTPFTFTLYEKQTGSAWIPLPNMAYTVYNKNGEKVTDSITDENGQLQIYAEQKVVVNVPQFVTLRLVEDNTGKYRLKTDDDGNLTEDALVIGDDTLTNVHEISNGFSMDTETEVPDGMPVGNDVAISRLIFKEGNYFYMGIRFVELADKGTTARTKEENWIYKL